VSGTKRYNRLGPKANFAAVCVRDQSKNGSVRSEKGEWQTSQY